MTSEPARWDHNIHYHPVALAAVPGHAERALDVGCGDGMLARRLRRRVRHVVAIDRDERSVRVAPSTDGVDYVLGDFLTHPFRPGGFDFVVFVASLHHMDVPAALARAKDLLRPGGRLAVIGLARSRQPVDLVFDVAGHVAHLIHARSRTEWEQKAPTVWPPPMTYGQIRRITALELPGSTYTRRLLWRYTLTWTKPDPADRAAASPATRPHRRLSGS